MEEIIIYVAGNPDAYPVEFYDSDTGTYQGMIPGLLEAFSEETGYEIRYLEPGERDRREHMAENRQVDIISGCDDSGEFQLPEENAIEVLRAMEDGEEIVYRM